MKHFLLMLFLWGGMAMLAQGQDAAKDADALMIRKIYDLALTKGSCYEWLDYLATEIGGRISGSPEAARAVEYTKSILDTLGLDQTWLQPCVVPYWKRGEKELVRVLNSKKYGIVDLNALALGNSVGTGIGGLTASVVEVKSLAEVDELGTENLKGKIVFYNRPMDPTQLRTFNAYGGAVDQRTQGPARAARYGAVAALVRSMTTLTDDVPHTGVTVYEEGGRKIPAISISTMAADLLSNMLKEEADTRLYIRNTSQMMPDQDSYNVIGEIKGSTNPDEIILIGGHLDSWDVGGGAHDDGAGCIHAMEVLNLLKQLNYTPRRTIRCVLFMNEENGLVGGREYAKVSNEKGEFHMAAIESDAGGFTPRGFSCNGHESILSTKFKALTKWLPLLEPYNLSLSIGGSGADISPLKSQKGLLIGFRPDSQRYFDFHHTPNDTIEAVNERELQLGAAAITSLVYLLDKYGL